MGRPSYYYGRRHDYVFFPVAWTDEETGTTYEKGYYDENGTRYENVAFEQDGKFENVVCHCQYCGLDSILNLTADEAMSLKCPNCGAPMDVVSELDEYTDARAGQDYGYDAAQTKSGGRKRRMPVLLIVLLFFVAFSWISRTIGGRSSGGEALKPASNNSNGSGGYDAAQDLLGDTIGLAKTADGVYVVDSSASDKVLVWDEEFESYYDEDSNCWVWYNEDVSPAVWQYWYEGISSDYEESGWMEHYEDGWFIEASQGSWIELPSKYDTGALWYID